MMEEVLQHINAVPGVIGSLVCGGEGEVVAHAFPPLFDVSIMQQASAIVADRSGGVRSAGGTYEMLDLRYNDGRVIVKPLEGAYLLLLCTKGINTQVLTISLNVAKGKLEAAIPARLAALPAASAPVDATSSPSVAVASPAASGGLVLPACHLADRNAGNSFEQFGMAALTRTTAQQISAHFNTGAIKKLKLANQANGNSGTFAVMVVNENDTTYDGKVILCRTIEKKLQAAAGDLLVVEL